jgi:adenosylcobinamide-phosphate synthase
MEIILILTIALAIDLTLGDPPNAGHPVAWMGKVISWLAKVRLPNHPAIQFIYGIAITILILAISIIPIYLLLHYVKPFNFAAYIIIAGILLKFTFTISGLRRAALKISQLLKSDNQENARFELRALVSRNTSELPRPLLVSAAVESVAESTCDSLVAPLFYFLILGVPGAMAYRAINTLDAMIGYHGQYEFLGKFAARLDDVLNFIPARLTALLLVLASTMKKTGNNAWRTAWREHGVTESPNAGWPMAAMAGGLNVQLEKTGSYKLGSANAALVPDTINHSVNLSLMASFLWVIICLITGAAYFAITA